MVCLQRRKPNPRPYHQAKGRAPQPGKQALESVSLPLTWQDQPVGGPPPRGIAHPLFPFRSFQGLPFPGPSWSSAVSPSPGPRAGAALNQAAPPASPPPLPSAQLGIISGIN